jgi:arsenate reductase
LPPKNSTFEQAGRKAMPVKTAVTDVPAAKSVPPDASPKKPKKKVLFLCIGNACRSQMAEAIARHIASDIIEASSAGLSPLGYIAGPTVAVLLENGVSCEGQTSKSVRAANPESADLLINMSGYEVKNRLEPKDLPVEDWDVGDPFGSDLEIYRTIRDEVERRVIELADRLRASTPADSKP